MRGVGNGAYRRRFVSAREKLEKHSMPEPNSGCQLWLGSLKRDGYGSLNEDRAHRVAWREYRGPIPARLYVLHKCDVRSCVNPGHLFLGTHQDNMDDMVRKGRVVTYRGERHPLWKLTDQQRQEVALDRRPQAAIAKAYGIAPSRVCVIKRLAREATEPQQ